MIEYHYETDFKLKNKKNHTLWISRVAENYGKSINHINYVFCDDSYLLDINRQYLNHDYLTDIITFPYDMEQGLTADIFISIDRVKENAETYNSSFEEELRRVIIHGVLHLTGLKDSSESEKKIMRLKEDVALEMFHVKP